jgi:ankyrin repeat protein
MADGADFEAYREALIAGEPARVAAMVAADGRNLPVDVDGVTVLHKALHIYSGNRLAIVQVLISAGADVNARMKDGRTPLHFASGFGVVDAVPVLLKAGAVVDARDEDGNTPLFVASREIAPLLIAAGADVRATNHEGNVPLHRNHQAALLASGVNVRNKAGLTPLHYAALAGNEQAIEWLLSQGADPQARTTAPTFYRASNMSKMFGPGDAIPVGSRPLDLARAQHRATRWNTNRYEPAVKLLSKATR